MKNIKEQDAILELPGDPTPRPEEKQLTDKLKDKFDEFTKKKCGKYNLSDLDSKFEDVMINYITNPSDLDTKKESLHCRTGDVYFWGQDKDRNKKAYRVIVKDGGNDFDFIDDDGQQKHISEFFSQRLEETLNISEQKNNNMENISQRLDEIYFYTVSRDGVSKRVIFTTEDISEIKKHLEKLMQLGETGDTAFIKAVVLSKGFDKNNEPIIKLGSFPPSTKLDIGKTPGLMSVLNTIYFSIINKEGPDPRDLKIVIGDKYSGKKVNPTTQEQPMFDEKNYMEPQMTQPTKEEPFEQVMKQKEKKGLESLLTKDEVSNDLTKKQKEILKKLKRKGFKFSEPKENKDNYSKKKIKSREFSENLDVWVPKNQ